MTSSHQPKRRLGVQFEESLETADTSPAPKPPTREPRREKDSETTVVESRLVCEVKTTYRTSVRKNSRRGR